ncbi:hypothetical protein K7X08_034588 [Anisodus acutangulus]|uniref:Uncharacterized protein n=1 Tax=Anisodus acutangulus TaxID=402998 RepID=A0A9Q1LIJ0_9SOLA|nr:hypothetical protein K7X08_034588 [Anisodus acutangulus]
MLCVFGVMHLEINFDSQFILLVLGFGGILLNVMIVMSMEKWTYMAMMVFSGMGLFIGLVKQANFCALILVIAASDQRLLLQFRKNWASDTSGNLEGTCISLVIIRINVQNLIFLELEVDYSGWFVKYRVNLDFLPNLYPAMVNQEALLLALPGKIILYNLGNGMIKELADVKPASFRRFVDVARYDGFEMYKHVETLASV